MDKAYYERLQTELAKKVRIPAEGRGYLPNKGDIVFAFDVHYRGVTASVGLAIHELGWGIREVFAGTAKVDFPYIPGLFCFREGPPILKTYNAALRKFDYRPNLILVDGHGIAHPRRFGLACWIGLMSDVPAIGCAKSTLLRYQNRPGKLRGDFVLIKSGTKTAGAALVTRDRVKPVFVSPGYMVSLAAAIDTIFELTTKYKIPDPLRVADRIAKGKLPFRLTSDRDI